MYKFSVPLPSLECKQPLQELLNMMVDFLNVAMFETSLLPLHPNSLCHYIDVILFETAPAALNSHTTLLVFCTQSFYFLLLLLLLMLVVNTLLHYHVIIKDDIDSYD